MLKNNPRKIWRVINPVIHPDKILADSNNNVIPMSECVQILNDALISLLTSEDIKSCPKINFSPDITMPKINISEAEYFIAKPAQNNYCF